MSLNESNLHPFLRDFVDNNQFLLIYGPPATGKTHLAFEIAKYLMLKGRSFSLLITEASTLTYARHLNFEIPVIPIVTKEQLVKEVMKSAISGKYMIIDSINWPFRSFDDEVSQKELSFISAILSISGGFATGQISQIDSAENKLAMDIWIVPWTKVIGITKKKRENKVELKIVKPREIILEYNIVEGGVQWS